MNAPLPERTTPVIRVRRESLTTHRTQAGFTSDRQLAVRMGVDHSTMHRVLTRKSEPSNGFIAAALEALPEATFEDLFEH